MSSVSHKTHKIPSLGKSLPVGIIKQYLKSKQQNLSHID